MQAEKFYKNIQQKVNEYDFQPELSDWNKQDVWQRIEQKQVKPKTPFVWWQAAAAILILAGSFTYFNSENFFKNTDNQAFEKNKNTISTQESFANITKSTQKTKQQYSAFTQTTTIQNSFQESKSMNSAAENETTPTTLSEPKNLASNEVNVSITEQSAITENKSIDTPNSENVAKENTFVPNKALLAVKVPSKRERIAILEIPEDDDAYNMPRKENRKGFFARLTRKMNNSGSEKNDELPSINGKPNKVWAFVKESFKNETINTDSTNR